MIAVVFPGQGSQKPGMGQQLFERVPESRAVFDAVHEATGIDLGKLCFESDDDTLRQTQNAQIALYTVGLAAFSAIRLDLPDEFVLAGHSVGEYAAVVGAGALSIEEGAKLVQRRGELMASSGAVRPGTMAAVLGLEREQLEAVCAQASDAEGVAVIANDNCPGQLVISGDVAAVERAGKLASEAGAKRVLPLSVSGAFHSPLMEGPAAQMGEALRAAAWQEQKLSVFANVSASAIEHGSEWADLLERQLKSPVRWTESVRAMLAAGVDLFIECGPGEVLSGLIKRIDKEVRTARVSDTESLLAARASLGVAV
jgi:[acyl-carrier-protein] S-malonyltransferase